MEEHPDPSARPPAAGDLPMSVVAPVTSAPAETLSGGFFWLSLRRAFRLDIKTDEVLPSERAVLAAEARHLRNPEHQAFLAWRRSVLLLVAIMFVPLTASRVLETFDGPEVPHVGRAFQLLPALAEGFFCLVAFAQLKNWAQWRHQRRALFIAWVIYFIAPFVVFSYPFRHVYDNYYVAADTLQHAANLPFQISHHTFNYAIGMMFGMQALLVLGPKVISLMPGMIRASIVTKLQFPGLTAPGWLMMLAAPVYALFAYIIVLLPYQITGSWEFVVGNLGVMAAQLFIGISGRRLTVPLTNEESYRRVHKTWLAYIAIIVLSLGFMVYGFRDFIHELNLGTVRVVTGVLSIASNVLLDTLIGADAIIAAMSYLRRRTAPDPRHEQLMRDAEMKLDVFTA
jgi:hypothetical protein